MEDITLKGVKVIRYNSEKTGDFSLVRPKRGGDTHMLPKWWEISANNQLYLDCTVLEVGGYHLVLDTQMQSEIRIIWDGTDLSFPYWRNIERGMLCNPGDYGASGVIKDYIFPSIGVRGSKVGIKDGPATGGGNSGGGGSGGDGGTDGGGGGGVPTPITEDQLEIGLPDNNGQPLLTNTYYPFTFEITGDDSAVQQWTVRGSSGSSIDPGLTHTADGKTEYAFFENASEALPGEDNDWTGSYVEILVWYYTDEEKTQTTTVSYRERFTTVEHPDSTAGAFWPSFSTIKNLYDGTAKSDYGGIHLVKQTPVEITYRMPVGTDFDPSVDDVFYFTIAESQDKNQGRDYDPALEPVQQGDGTWVFPVAGDYYVKNYYSCGKIHSPAYSGEWVTIHDS